MDDARTTLFPLYSSMATPAWLRALGADIGKDVEASTALMLPTLTTVGDGAFLADDTLIGSYELGHGWLRVERSKVGKRAFLGNSGMIAPGRAVPKRGLVAVLSATPEDARAGTSWLGSPPVKLRRVAGESDDARTFAPADAAAGRSRARRAVPDRAGDLHVRARRRGPPGPAGGARRVGSRGCRGALRAGRAGGRRRRVRAGHGRPSGCSSVGCAPVTTRCGARSSGATSWPTRSSRSSPSRGWDRPRTARPR